MTGLDIVALGVGIAIFITLGVFVWGLTRQCSAEAWSKKTMAASVGTLVRASGCPGVDRTDRSQVRKHLQIKTGRTHQCLYI